MEVKEWRSLPVTKALIEAMYEERIGLLEAILSSENRDVSSGRALGYTDAINFILGLEDSDVRRYISAD